MDRLAAGELGYSTVIQAWDFLAGSNFILEMDSAARQATRTIAVLSPDYLASQFTPSEWAAAFRQDPKGDKVLLPVRVRPCDVKGLLGQIVYLDLVGRMKPLAALITDRSPTTAQTQHSPTVPSHAFCRSVPNAAPLSRAFQPMWNIPYPRNPYFTGREELLQTPGSLADGQEKVGISQPQAVSGLGGVGKTQVALEYAYRYHQDYEAVLWTRADTQEALISGFVVFAALLRLPRRRGARSNCRSWRRSRHWLSKSHRLVAAAG